MKLFFLGTGAGVPSKERNVASIVLEMLQEVSSVWMFDCGEATQHQILRTNIRPRKIEKIFITHLHGDHIYGLPGLLSSRSFQNGDTPVTVYGPKGIKEYVEISLNVSETKLAYPLNFVEVHEGIIFEDDHFKVLCRQLDHGITSYGYRVVEKNLPGELQVDKLMANGIQPGPVYQQIKENEQYQLEDGQVVFRNEYLGPDKPGRIISILGDTRYLPEISDFVSHSDVLVHEATFEATNEELAFRYFHSTTKQAASLARNSEVDQLILTHISSRYQDDDYSQLLFEAQQEFNNTLIANDFFEYEIPQKKIKTE